MKVGIITFHNSNNCGSMLESYAIQKKMMEYSKDTEFINFSSLGQRELYSDMYNNSSIKNVLRNILLLPNLKKIKNNNIKYNEFKKNYFNLSEEYNNNTEIKDQYDVVVAGSDQIWNITIDDFDDAYFLNWVKKGWKIAYAPSFGSKNIMKYGTKDEIKKYSKLISDFDSLSVREKNGKKWIKDMIGKDVEVIIDPTLLYPASVYDKIIDNSCTPNYEYIFFYCPGFNRNLCKFVKKISKKYNLPVIVWSTKSYSTKCIWTFNFKLPKYESPSVYLSLIKHAKIIFTTSFHGTIFSTIYHKIFYTLKNGGMYGDDDRVKTLLSQLEIESRLIEPNFDPSFDYLKKFDYSGYEKKLVELKIKANNFLKDSIDRYEKRK